LGTVDKSTFADQAVAQKKLAATAKRAHLFATKNLRPKTALGSELTVGCRRRLFVIREKIAGMNIFTIRS
jgi:hypothetical protein